MTIPKKMKRLLIISINEDYLNLLSQQVKTILTDQIVIKSYTLKNINHHAASDVDAILLSSDYIYQLVKPFFPSHIPIFFGKRAINIVNLKQLMSLETGQNLLVVNDTRDSTNDTVKSLSELVSEHHYFPYYPEESIPDDIDYIVTPGEFHLVPASIKQVINIGARVLDISTISNIMEALDFTQTNDTLVMPYMKSLVAISGDYYHLPKSISEHIGHSSITTFNDIVFQSKLMSDVINKAMEIANSSLPIHIQGEAGTGKKLLAAAIHGAPQAADKPFTVLDCGEKSLDELEIDLFGIETASEINIGVIEGSNQGVVYLKNIETLNTYLQNRLQVLLETNQITRKNGRHPIDVQIRLITSSSINLSKLNHVGRFNTNLYNYLTHHSIKIPPLRDRIDDLDVYMIFFKNRFNTNHLSFSDEAMSFLKSYTWPGNVRELFNLFSYCICINEHPISIQSLPHSLQTTIVNMRENQQQLTHEELIKTIENHGFLDESIAILKVFKEGKDIRTSYGRKSLEKILTEQYHIVLTEQQLRQRLKILDELKLINVRQGRAGTTISYNGEIFLTKQE